MSEDLEQDNLLPLMDWQLNHPDLDKIQKDAIQAQELGDYNHPALKEFMKAPKLTGYEEAFWEAYGELCTCRPSSGMGGMLPIPFTAIITYAEFWGYTRSETEALWKAVRAMDNMHVKHSNAKLAEKQ